jgi:hypothetical protein
MKEFMLDIHIKLIAYLRDNIEEFFSNPRWFFMRKMARFHAIRNLKKASLNKWDNLRDIEKQESKIFPEINVEDVVNSLKKDGLFQGINLPTYIVNDILQFALNTDCYGSKKPNFGFRVHEKEKAELHYGCKFLVAKYFNTASQCPAIKMLENDPILLNIAAKYFKTKPVHIANSLWWSFPRNSTFLEQSKAAQVFHCDLDDYDFIKFFFYITDVDLDSGPHVYIQGSHKKKKFLYQLLRGRATKQDLINYYGQENIVNICGAAGWGFAEDTFGYHKGSHPINQARLILQVEFATYNYQAQHDEINPIHLKAISFKDEDQGNLNTQNLYSAKPK